jgi:hypothetical protein
MDSLGLSLGDRPSQVVVPQAEPVNASRGGDDE